MLFEHRPPKCVYVVGLGVWLLMVVHAQNYTSTYISTTVLHSKNIMCKIHKKLLICEKCDSHTINNNLFLTISISPSTCFSSSGDSTFSSSSGDINFFNDILRLVLLLAPERSLISESSEVGSSEALGLMALSGDPTPLGETTPIPGVGRAGDACLLERLLVLCSMTVESC